MSRPSGWLIETHIYEFMDLTMSHISKILIVDDEPRMLESLKVLLSSQGCEIHITDSGREALEYLERTAFDLVLLDIVMPDIDGFQIMDRIKTTNKDMLVIILTGHASIESAIEALRRGAYDYIRKPFEPEELLTTVKNALSHQKTIRNNKQVGKALRESEEKYRLLFSNVSDVIFSIDRDFRVTNISPSVEKVLGYKPEELIGKPFQDLNVLAPGYSELAFYDIKRILEGERISPVVYEFISKKGTSKFAELTASPLVQDEKITAVISVARDITKRKHEEEEKRKLQDRLQRAQKFEAMGTVAGGVAHDLNNVLAGIVAYPDLLLMQLPEDSDLRKHVLAIQKSGQKAAVIVQDLLTLARRGVTVKEVVKLNDVISEYLNSSEYEKLKIYNPGVELETDLEAGLLNILGSPVHLSKIIMNLVSNAAEAMDEGGKVFISTKNQYIDKTTRGYIGIEEGDYIVLTVSDSGAGISPEDKERIFEPFYTKKIMGRSGTGLGMAVVWGSVKDHNGYIDVQSAQGKGTTFTFFFPVTRQEMAEKKTRLSYKDYTGRQESILVVDDIEEQREIASNILAKLGYSATAVSSGEEALEHLKKNTADLIILDMIMDPGMDGLDTYKKVLELYPGQKAIIASGFSETARVREAERLGAGRYVKKPYTMERLGLAVKHELDKEKRFDAPT